MRTVAVLGVGMTRFGKTPDRSIGELAGEALSEALKDSALGPDRVEQVYFANAIGGLITGQEMVRGQVALRDRGLAGIPFVNVENACASASTAFSLACSAVRSGAADIALAVGVEKMTHPDRARTLRAIGTAADVERAAEELFASDPAVVAQERSPFMDLYAHRAKEYLRSSEATEADLADVAVKNHEHGEDNPSAQYGMPLSREEVLESRTIAGPLTLYMCAPVSDGAAAAVVVGEELLDSVETRPPIFVRASAMVSGAAGTDIEPAQVRAARRAYESSGIGPEELDVVEVHDATAVAELIAYEDLALAPRGEAALLLRSGATRIGDRLPVNPSGGLLSRGHPIGATGLAQIVELVSQLRGAAGGRQVRDASVGLSSNEGGWVGHDVAACAVHILARDPD